ncbi:MAG: helix-turn-helix transcriptional regulator [Pseudomonadota bacterium]
MIAKKKPPKGRVNNEIRALRREAGLTQQDLADHVGATRQTIVAIEQGKYAPSLELAFRIARAFARDFEDVFQFNPEG